MHWEMIARASSMSCHHRVRLGATVKGKASRRTRRRKRKERVAAGLVTLTEIKKRRRGKIREGSRNRTRRSLRGRSLLNAQSDDKL